MPDEEMVNAGALLIRLGSVARAERALMEMSAPMTQETAQNLVAEAHITLVSSAPRELRQSFEAVISYHRWNHLFELAVSQHRMPDAMEAQRQIDKLMRSVH